MAQDLARYDVDERLYEIDGPARCALRLEHVLFVAKNGPRPGETIDYVKPELNVQGTPDYRQQVVRRRSGVRLSATLPSAPRRRRPDTRVSAQYRACPCTPSDLNREPTD